MEALFSGVVYASSTEALIVELLPEALRRFFRSQLGPGKSGAVQTHKEFTYSATSSNPEDFTNRRYVLTISYAAAGKQFTLLQVRKLAAEVASSRGIKFWPIGGPKDLQKKIKTNVDNNRPWDHGLTGLN